MNMQVQPMLEPPAPKTLADMRLPTVMMRDILLKTMFRANASTASEIAKQVALPLIVAQELIDIAREQKLLEAHIGQRLGRGRL